MHILNAATGITSLDNPEVKITGNVALADINAILVATTGKVTATLEAGTANDLAKMSSTFQNVPGYIPTFNIFKGTVLKVRAFKNGAIPSPIITKTYFVIRGVDAEIKKLHFKFTIQICKFRRIHVSI